MLQLFEVWRLFVSVLFVIFGRSILHETTTTGDTWIKNQPSQQTVYEKRFKVGTFEGTAAEVLNTAVNLVCLQPFESSFVKSTDTGPSVSSAVHAGNIFDNTI